MKLFNFNYTMEISTKPDKADGDDEVWDIATDGLKEALEENNLPYTYCIEGVGRGHFLMGPTRNWIFTGIPDCAMG